MSRIVIAPASVMSLYALNRLFANAVGTNFAYFPPAIQKSVINDHSVFRLILGTIDRHRVILTARADGKIIGYAIGAAPAIGPAQLFWLYVDPSFRGANTGLSLLSRMLRHLQALGAEIVSIATHDHRAYYERQGFKFIKRTLVNGVKMDILNFRLAPAVAK
jgi:ribosomal protein S18 acetylase RimI-like enzyme